MSGNEVRARAVIAANKYEYPEPSFNYSEAPTAELFGANVFSTMVMKQRLPKAIYQSLMRTIETGSPLDTLTADTVASAMKDWAISKGATHYAHIFYPLTGRTAEKHDSFYEPGVNKIVSEFTGALLMQQEPDGSSFPNGGIRPAHRARAYTAWDVTSPAYLVESTNGTTLCIPTCFVSWTGEALDNKTPILRSSAALNTQAQRILRLFGHKDISMVNSTAGAEQEYFLVDTNFVLARPDLLVAGRTLFGAPAPKGQEFDDHYFGVIPERVQAFMFEFERELFKLGIPVKTRHNEVAPGQYEVAPIFEGANIASDHQQLIMITLKKVADKYGLTSLMHEKPFAGLNGSGKHINFSLNNTTQGNLFDPGETPHDNAQFLVFCAAVIRAVGRHAKLLRAVVASASNDLRLGEMEAPPTIMSIFLGDHLTEIFEQIKTASGTASSLDFGALTLGVDTLPTLPKHSSDRNRTSPFAFTGNKFEFRSVGSFQSIAPAMTILNAILTESLDYIATQLEDASGDFYDNVQALLKEIIAEHETIIFNGDGYSKAWEREAKSRGLVDYKSSVDALPVFGSPGVIKLFEKYGILSRSELQSRLEVYLEQYVMTITVEAKLMIEMSRTIIFPAAIRYQNELASTCANLIAVGYEFDTDTLDRVTNLVKALQDSTSELEKLVQAKNKDAQHACRKTLPAMDKVRQYADELEGIVADDLWPLPTYQEMLFIK